MKVQNKRDGQRSRPWQHRYRDIVILFASSSSKQKKCKIWREKHVIQQEIIYVFMTHANDFANRFLRIAFLSFNANLMYRRTLDSTHYLSAI